MRSPTPHQFVRDDSSAIWFQQLNLAGSYAQCCPLGTESANPILGDFFRPQSLTPHFRDTFGVLRGDLNAINGQQHFARTH